MSDERKILDGTDTESTRRDALKKIGVGAGVAWAAPTILTLNSPAAAASTPCTYCSGAELLTDGTGSPGWTLTYGSYSSPSDYLANQDEIFDLLMVQTATPSGLTCDGETVTLRFSLSSAASVLTARIRQNTSVGSEIAVDTTTSSGAHSLSGTIPPGTTAFHVRIYVDGTSSPIITLSAPSLTISCP